MKEGKTERRVYALFFLNILRRNVLKHDVNCLFHTKLRKTIGDEENCRRRNLNSRLQHLGRPNMSARLI